LERLFKQDPAPESRFTTFFDLYALPPEFPGFDAARSLGDPYQKVASIERAFAKAMSDSRFISYLSLHEFEALIFADPSRLDLEYLEHEKAIASLQALAAKLEPECINETPHNAPSKRIIAAIPEYAGSKATVGPATASAIGLAKLRSRCPHFGAWLDALEALAPL
jgi:hypothetical protein